MKQKIVKKGVQAVTLLIFSLAFLSFFCSSNAIVAKAESVELPECGCVANDTDGEVTYSTEAIDTTNLPSSVDLSADIYFPPIGNQLPYGSCTSWATVYYQYTYEVAKANGWNAKTNAQYRFSPEYVYALINSGLNAEGEEKGSGWDQNYAVLTEIGAVRFNEFTNTNKPFGWYSGSNQEQFVQALRQALQMRVSNVYTRSFVNSSNEVDLDQLKAILNQGHCITFSVYTPADSFQFETTNNNQWAAVYAKYPQVEEGKSPTAHAMTIVGYDDSITYTLPSGQQMVGAFKVADSLGANYQNRNQGFIWIMYDAFYDQTQCPGVELEDKIHIYTGNSWRYIEVSEYDLDLTVEVTVEQLKRNDITIKLYSADTPDGAKNYKETFVDQIGHERAFNGSTTATVPQEYTFVFDYEMYDFYTDGSKYYGVEITDNNNNGANTVIKKIVWRDENGDEIHQLTPNDELNASSKTYYTAGQYAEEVVLSDKRIQKGDSTTLIATVLPSDTTNKELNWESSNSSIATVDSNGVVTAHAVGEVTITATAVDKALVSGFCIISVVEGYGSGFDDAVAVQLNTKYNGELVETGDESWFKFTPTQSARYLLYTSGGSDTNCVVYNSSKNSIFSNNDISTTNSNCALSVNLIAGSTYYIKIGGTNINCSTYIFRIVNASVSSAYIDNVNPDARQVKIVANTAAFYNNLNIFFDNQSFSLNKGTGNTIQTTVNGVRFKITVSYDPQGNYAEWTILADISGVASLIGTEIDVELAFLNNSVGSGRYDGAPAIFAYKSSLIAGVNVSSSSSLQQLISTLQETGYTLSVYHNNDSTPISLSSPKRAVTGMKIVQRNSDGNITEVFHVIVLGDVQGDGFIDSSDASIVLSYDVGTGTLTGAYLLAADVDQSGSADSSDSSIILQYDLGIANIAQVLEITEVPSVLYYGTPVAF